MSNKRQARSKDEARYEIEIVALDALIPYARNARAHSDEQIAQVIGSLKEFGWTNPILIDAENVIVAGHCRVRAAMRARENGIIPNGWEHGLDAVPCIRLLHLTDAQRRAYTIADNKLALNAHWDNEMLIAEIDALVGDAVDLSLLGFDDAEVAQLRIDSSEPLTDQRSEWTEMPEYENPKHVYRKIIVNFADEEGVREFFKVVQQEYTDATRYIWFPPVERRDLASLRYAEVSASDDEEQLS